MSIPKIIHQCWKTDDVPKRWRPLATSVKRYHPGWKYKLWTDASMEQHVKQHHPDLYPVYMDFELNIMRADVFRYVIMYDEGGMYCDLDYEFIRPYDYGDTDLMLSTEFDPKYGDAVKHYANYIFASVPKYPLWRDMLDDLIKHPPVITPDYDLVHATGPVFLTRIFNTNQHKYTNYNITPRLVFSPIRIHDKREKRILLNNDITRGIHHGDSSWKNRFTLKHLKIKAKDILDKHLKP